MNKFTLDDFYNATTRWHREDSILLLSHTDTDGYMAQWFMRKFLNDGGFRNITNINVNYNYECREETMKKYKHIIITDLSNSFDEWQLHDSIWCFDHHETNKNKFIPTYLDTKTSATGIVNTLLQKLTGIGPDYTYLASLVTAWDIFTWKNETGDDRIFPVVMNQGIMGLVDDACIKYDTFIDYDIDDLLDIVRLKGNGGGEYSSLGWLRYESLTTNTKELMGRIIQKCNLGYVYINELDIATFSYMSNEYLSEETPLLVGILTHKPGVYSMRSINSINSIAVKFGGGGHPNACGFTDNENDPCTVIDNIYNEYSKLVK